MSYSSYNPQTRYRDRSKQRVLSFFKVFLFCMLLMGAGFFAGQQFSENELSVLKDQMQIVQNERDDLRDEVTDLLAQVQTANARVEDVREAFNQAIPEGPIEDLVVSLHQQIKAGVDIEYLKRAIETAQSPKSCSEPTVLRFVASTPEFKGPDSQVSINEGLIVVSGAGISAVNDQKEPEAWYDPTKEVELVLQIGEETLRKKGVMPLTFAVILEDQEYRFRAEPGATSFIKLTYDVCSQA